MGRSPFPVVGLRQGAQSHSYERYGKEEIEGWLWRVGIL